MTHNCNFDLVLNYFSYPPGGTFFQVGKAAGDRWKSLTDAVSFIYTLH